jgi:hypothetical protein
LDRSRTSVQTCGIVVRSGRDRGDLGGIDAKAVTSGPIHLRDYSRRRLGRIVFVAFDLNGTNGTDDAVASMAEVASLVRIPRPTRGVAHGDVRLSP